MNSNITRMATLVVGGRITEQLVTEEIGRLQSAWAGFLPQVADDGIDSVLSEEALAELDLFDCLQLAEGYTDLSCQPQSGRSGQGAV